MKLIECPTCQLWDGVGCPQGRNVDDQGNPIEIVDCLYFDGLNEKRKEDLLQLCKMPQMDMGNRGLNTL